MASITVHCKMCKHVMKFSAEKAGKRAKCPKCDTVVLIKAEDEAQKPEPAPETPAPPPKPADDDEYGATGSYDVFLDPEIAKRQKELAEEEANRHKKKKDRKKLPTIGRKVKVIPDAPAWSMIRWGMLLVFIGVWIWLACHLLQGSYVILGSVEFPEYASMMARNLEQRNNEGFPEVGQGWDLDWLEIYLGMVAGHAFLDYARVCLTLASVLYFFQAILWALGYGCCFPVPRRFGMFGHVIILIALAVFNILVMFVFKLLPVTGVHSLVMIPFIIPEIVLTEYNMERMVAINILWSGAPFWENTFSLLFKFLFYLEPTFLSIFIWSAGVAIKDETIEQGGKGRVQMALGTFFILVCFHLLSLCGASPILVLVLRVIYVVWFFFLIIFMLQFAMLLLKVRSVLYDKINPRNELETKDKEDDDADDDDDDEDDDEDEKPKKKKKK